MKKRFLASLLSLALLLALLPVSALAAGETIEYDLSSGSLVVLNDSSYTVTSNGTATENTITIEAGICDLTISDLKITATDAPAICVKAGATLNLTLSGTNTLKGAPGYAGISVAAAWDGDDYNPETSGKVVIDGTGVLNVTGGDADGTKRVGGGAGIGGDAFHMIQSSNGADFGVVEINGGTINATGGNATIDGEYGAGAGIGGGSGLYHGMGDDAEGGTWHYSGIIIISNGIVTANGGDNIGAAGIGAGSQCNATDGHISYTACEGLSISISGGIIKAQGGTVAAGIGGSANGDHGNIEITGGTIEAIGAAEDSTSSYGGAGIGGGDGGGGLAITIGGTAEVLAKGGGAGAGIGGGNGGYSDAIIIEGSANVTAYGGFPPDRTSNKRGGAGIGSGNNVNIVTSTVRYETIQLNTTGNIIAYGGKGAQAIGLGTCASSGSDNTKNNHLSVTIGENSGEIWMFNYDNDQSAIHGVNADKTVDGTKIDLGDKNALYWNADKENSAWYKLGSDSDSTTHTWSADGDTLTVRKGSETVASRRYDATWHEASDNWAMIKSLPKYTVTYEANGGDGTMTDDSSPYDPNAEVTVLPNSFTKDGYQFTGWNTAEDGSGISYRPNETFSITADTTLYAQWVKAYTVTYNLNGGKGAEGADYTEKAVEENTVVALAAAPTKDGYTFTGWSDGTKTYQPGTFLTVTGNITLTAQWSKNGGDEGGGSGDDGDETTYYTLRYESNGGTKYWNERYAEDTVVKLNQFPTREGYIFTGWYADEDLTEPISSVKMTKNRTVYAGWRAATVPDLLNGSDHFAYVVGYSDGTVRPMNNISRAQVATIFFRLLQPEIRAENLTVENTFADVNGGMWCNTAVSTMARLGIVTGRTTEKFDPNAAITRGEFAVICARFDASRIDGGSNFTDIANHWAKAGIERAVSLGWIRGYTDGTFRPNQSITRAEAMTMINRMLCRIPENEDDLLPGMNVWLDNQPGDGHYLAVQEATNSHDFQYKGEIYEYWTELNADPDWTRYQD